jgi:DnaJ family protein A protein 2
VVLVIQQKEHDVFKRIGTDLIIKKTITLTEALCGTSFLIKHLDGRMLRVTTPPGEVIKPDTFKRIVDEGMPVHGRPFMKGNMYVHFEVSFPDTLDAGLVAELKKVLPPAPVDNTHMDVDADDVHDVASMSTVKDIEDELKSRAHLGKGGGSEAYDSEDDDMPHGAQRVQCAQQ